MYKLLIPLIIFVLISCSSAPEIEIPEDIAAMENVAVYSGDVEPVYSISFEKEAVFGDTESVFINRISGIDVDNEGNLYLADSGEATVHVYDSIGKYKFSIGQKGDGPGEFNAAYRPTLFEDELYVLDVQQQRISVFDPADGTIQRTISVGGGGNDLSGFPNSFTPMSGNRFLVYYSSMSRDGERFLRKLNARILDAEGKIIESDIIDFEPGEMFMIQSENSIQIMSFPFMRDSKAVLDQDENIIWGYTDRIFLQVVSLDGEYNRSIYFSRENPPLDRAALIDNNEDSAIRDAIRSLDVPSTCPAFGNLLVDDENRIWLELHTEDENESEWWVLDETGEKLALFLRPDNHQLERVKNGYVYFRETDEETGLQEVVKYRYQFQS
tara:strand:+ start:4021 stop:5169 length:1149 start_codon:yes stop_codon:yes gene_type:complete